jgi:hypothetical protein
MYWIMKIRHLAFTTLAAIAAGLSQIGTSAAQAAVLGGSGTCSNVTFGYINCAGAFAGNDKGAQGTGLTNLNSLFGTGWYFAGDNEDGTASFSAGGLGTKTGSATSSLSGAGAIAIKAGNSYSLYTVANLASFNWATTGVTLVGKNKNVPGLSHVSLYAQRHNNPVPQDIPEPGTIVALLAAGGLTAKLKRQAQEAIKA